MKPAISPDTPDALPDKIRFDQIVIGAGVVGLAIARALAQAGQQTGQQVLLLESQAKFGTGISSRSSEVIHAGIYYPPDSLKARLCVAGNRALYPYCQEHHVNAQRIGKLIVAVEESEIAALQSYQQRAINSGVHKLEWLNAAQIAKIEPSLRAVAGLFSPDTGIIDSHGLMAAYLHDFLQAEGTYVAHSPVLSGEIIDDGFNLQIGGRDPCQIVAPVLINAAGMGAQKFASQLNGFPQQFVPELHFAVGHYFAMSAKTPFHHLVYPVAVAGGLGVHLTLDLAGQARFGPDLIWREQEDYSFDQQREASFYQAIRRYWPALPDAVLTPAYTGIRPKLFGPVQADQDFLIQGKAIHGVPGLINLFGIESPGLTGSLALAEYVSKMLAAE